MTAMQDHIPLEPALRSNLLMLATAYVKHKGIKLSTVSRKVTSDAYFFDELRAGKIGFTVNTYDRWMTWFRENWPDDLEWPGEVWTPVMPTARRRRFARAR